MVIWHRRQVDCRDRKNRSKRRQVIERIFIFRPTSELPRPQPRRRGVNVRRTSTAEPEYRVRTLGRIDIQDSQAV
jgi:hypothetical protein